MFELPPPEWSYEVRLATGEVSKGSDKTDGDPFAQVQAEAAFGSVFVGGLAQNVDLDDGSDAELHLFAGWRGEVSGVEIEASAAREFYPGIRSDVGDQGEWEFALRATREIGPVGVTLTTEYSPDSVGEAGRSLWVEGELETSLGGESAGRRLSGGGSGTARPTTRRGTRG